LKAGTKVDLQDSCGKLALLLVLDSAHTNNEHKISIVRLLLEAKCDVNVRVGGTTALFLACKNVIPLFWIMTQKFPGTEIYVETL